MIAQDHHYPEIESHTEPPTADPRQWSAVELAVAVDELIRIKSIVIFNGQFEDLTYLNQTIYYYQHLQLKKSQTR